MTVKSLPTWFTTFGQLAIVMMGSWLASGSIAHAAQRVREEAPPASLEIRLLEEAAATNELIRLGDIAQVVGVDSEVTQQVSQLELFPTPTTPRRVQARDIAERLALRGLDPFYYQLTGATSILIQPSSQRTSRSIQQVDYREPVQVDWQETRYQDDRDSLLETAKQRVQEAALDLLRSRIGTDIHWKVNVELDPRFAAAVADESSPLILHGLRHPWMGTHEVRLQLQGEGNFEQIPATLDVQSNTLVVAATSPIGIGEIIQAENLELVPLATRPTYDDLVYRMEDVVGRESTRAIRVGENVRSSVIRAPIMVHRNEQVECFAIHGGVRATTTVKALQDGSIGSLIQVERLDRSAKFAARVTGPQQVEVFTAGTGRTTVTSLGR